MAGASCPPTASNAAGCISTDSNVEITGTSGYGALSIGDCEVNFKNSTVKAADYGMILMMGKGSGSFKDGTVVESGRFATVSSMNSGLLEVEGSTLNTEETTFVVKGCSTEFHVTDSVLTPKNGVILQVMDSDDPGNPKGYYCEPTEDDTPVEGRDLLTAVPGRRRCGGILRHDPHRRYLQRFLQPEGGHRR